MTRQHNPYLYGVRIGGAFYPLSYQVCEYKPYQDFGDYIEYYLEFSYIEKEYIDNIHRIKQAFYQRSLEISVEGYDKILDTYFINVSGIFDKGFEYGMDVWGQMFVRITVRKYKVGGGGKDDMKHHNGCKHIDKISGNCKLKPYGMFSAIFGRKCDYHPLYKFKCYEQEERPEFIPPKEQKPQGATFYNCEFIDCTFTETKAKPKTEAETLEEKYEEACGEFITRVRSCFDLRTEEYFILVKMKGIWLPLMEFYTLDKVEHMRIFLLLVERIKNEDSI